tara:strand:- start:1861 stop:2616 length:756 start_codon:yes stop_codon:yes gene_type:complete
MNLILEVGLNHFGRISESKRYLDFFLKSNFNFLTYQIQKESFYEKFKFKLPLDHYKFLIKKTHQKRKKIGLAVADLNSCKDIARLNFDFFKILSISLNDKKLINFISKFKKPIFISCGTASNNQIKKCLSNLNYYKEKISLIHTSLSYESTDQNLKRIELLKNFHSNVSYGHHYKNYFPIILLFNSDIKFFFIYIKSMETNKRFYPDDKHAFSFKKLKQFNKILDECNNLLGSKHKRNKHIKIINNEKVSF